MLREFLNIVSKYGITPYVKHSISKKEIEIRSTIFKIRRNQARHLEKRGRIREAIIMYKQAADLLPPRGYECLKDAAKLAEKNYFYREATLMWFETIYYASDFSSKFNCLKNSLRNLLFDFTSK